jgi:acyl-[acyl-carrier-protein]-phospholipid O-acyltransferase/long-chain-fatty-acid--[acyl-carrier-protein] ligase
VRQIEDAYGTILKISLALGRLVARVSSEREIVGVLLPNTVAAIGTVFGMSATRRIPAMLNYSAGPDAVRSAVQVAGIRTIITSRKFVEAARLNGHPAA